MTKMLIGRILTLLAIFGPAPAYAHDGVYIGSPANLKFVVDSNRVYFRNLDQFDANWRPCCYNYWIDLSSDNGKAQYALLLTSYASNKPISIYINDKAIAGPIGFLGPV